LSLTKRQKDWKLTEKSNGRLISITPEEVIGAIIGNKDFDCGTSFEATGCTNISN